MHEHNLYVGAGKGEILFPEEMFPTAEGYNKIHDNPHARIILMESATGRYAFAHLELNNIFETGTARMLEAIQQETGIEPDHVFFHCLHVLETPHPEPPMKKGPEAEWFNGLFYGAVEKAMLYWPWEKAFMSKPSLSFAFQRRRVLTVSVPPPVMNIS